MKNVRKSVYVKRKLIFAPKTIGIDVNVPLGFFDIHTKELPFSIIPPAAELLLRSEIDNFVWPEEIKNNPELRRQAKNRRRLVDRLGFLFTFLAKTGSDISQVINSKLISHREVAAIYKGLSDFIESEPYNARLLLYLPFELIPDVARRFDSIELNKSINSFRALYLNEWHKLLPVHDIRANFFDGDILEPGFDREPLTKVSKAAHLIPMLFRKGMISFAEVIKMVKESLDQITKDSILDTIPVLADLHLLSEDDLNRLSRSDDILLRNLSIIIRDSLKSNNQSVLEPAILRDKVWLQRLMPKIRQDFASTDDAYKRGLKNLSLVRANWEKRCNVKNLLKEYSNEISKALVNGSLSLADIERFISLEPGEIFKLIGIHSLRWAVEKLAAVNASQARTIGLSSEPLFCKLWESNNLEIQNALENTWSHWLTLGVINQKYLKQSGIKLPLLDRPFSVDGAGLTLEFKELSQVTKLIENDAELSKLLYPVFIIYGSKVKGYGSKTADIDLAVFIKPGIKMIDRGYIQELLSQLLKHENIKGRALEFWLFQAGEDLQIKDFPSFDKSIGDSFSVHVLFNGVWCGKPETVKELYGKLMAEYLYSHDENTADKGNRHIWLSEIERDILQYRLMHKGYAHFWPEQGGIHTKHSVDIDSDSTFWDSGYRRMATKLFISRVFLPRL